MKEVKLCPACNAPLPTDAPEGLCPRCIGKAALETQSVNPSGVTTEQGSVTPGPPPAPPAPAEIARYFPQLEILELLGQGGMGVVYKARQPRLDRIVALKILPVEIGRDPAFAERFTREARALARLNHPSIVAVYDFGQAEGFYYFIMEWVDGADLRQLEQTRRLTPQEALGIVPKICEALQYAHDEGIVHRDIKPGNILIDKRGRVKIADFGLAKLMDRPATDLVLTQLHQVMGTPQYMAPEQVERPTEVDHRADIYSLGVVFYEMLTGELPIGRFAPPSQKVHVDVRLDEVVLKSLEKEPQRRYQHASEVRTDVEHISNENPSGDGGAACPTPSGMERASPSLTTLPMSGIRELPSSFWFRAQCLFLLGWFGYAALWNLRIPGCLIAVLLMACAIMFVARRRMHYLPELDAAWQQRSALQRRIDSGTALLGAAFGCLLVLGSFSTAWERSPFSWNLDGKTDSAFAAEYKGREYQLIRDLSAFKEQVPTVELRNNGGQWTGGWKWFAWRPTGPHNRLYGFLSILTSVGLGIASVAGALQAQVAGWKDRRAWKHYPGPALGVAGAFLLSTLNAGLLLILFHAFMTSGTSTVPERRFRVRGAGIDEVTQAVQQWGQRNGYAFGDKASWSIDSVPQGKSLGQVRLLQAWKPAPFDRWVIGLRGAIQVSPHLVIRAVASQEPAETLLTISAGREVKRKRHEIETWKSVLDNLEAAIEDKATRVRRLTEGAEIGLSKPARSSPPLAIAPFSAGEARQYQHRWSQFLGLPLVSTNSSGIKLAVIPPGEFDMGSTKEDMDLLPLPSKKWFFSDWATVRIQCETPRHHVRLSRPFLLGVHEVTIGQFGEFVQATGYGTRTENDPRGGFGWSAGTWAQKREFNWRNPGFPQSDDHPVSNVSWEDAAAFCRWLSEKENKKYRLPTEAEWEFACRAGTTTWYSSGDRDETLRLVANVADASLRERHPPVEWAESWNDGYVFTAPVGSFEPNAFGLHDMHGNVWEWCADWYDPAYYRRTGSVDPPGPTYSPQRAGLESYRVFRGGGWDNYPGFCRSADRYSSHSPLLRTSWAGFRVVREP
jgi:formylglycine-generating enzyme required for sulfatase activity/tRNA A-37 threonylcarbamoyl transferase component Bud32